MPALRRPCSTQCGPNLATVVIGFSARVRTWNTTLEAMALADAAIRARFAP